MLPTVTARIFRLALLPGLLLAGGHAHAQTPAADTTQPRPLARHLVGIGFGLGASTVNADDDYYLPNDDVKLGSEVGFTYTYFFGRQEPVFGLRTGLGLLSRSGNYQFLGPYAGQRVRRTETMLTVPLELVTRRRWAPTSRWYSAVALGGYFGELLSRYTYTLDPLSGKTQRRTDSWVYATGGVSLAFGVGYQATRHRARELGVRLSGDLFAPKTPAAGELPNLRQSNVSVYYTVYNAF